MGLLSKEHQTPSLKKEEIRKSWVLIDATGKNVGRLCSVVAARLRGKHLPTFTPNQDCGDNIIIINADKVNISGNKSATKNYYHHSRYPGGMKATPFHRLIDDNPERIILEGVKGMLPKSKLGEKMLTNLRVYPGGQHELGSQKPTVLNI